MSALSAIASFQVAGCHVVRHGLGPRMVVGFHGWSGSHESFRPLVDRLPPQVSFFAFDLPGSGQSEGVKRWTADAVVDRLERALSELGLSRVELLMACGGVGFGARLAARRPELFTRLVMVDPFAYLPWYFRVFLVPVLGPVAYWSAFANPLGRWLTNSALVARRTEDSSLTEGFARTRHMDNRGQLASLADVARRPLEELGAFTGPVHIVFGEKTFAAVRESTAMLKGPFPQAQVSVVRGAGHLPMHEATDEVAAIVFADETMVGPREGEGVDGAEPRDAAG